MRDDPDTKRGRTYLAGVEELGVTCLGCFWHRAFFRWEDDGRPVEMFSDLASQALEAKCVRSAQLAAAVWCAVNAALLFFRAWLDLDAARGFDELYADLIAAGAPSIAEAWAPRIAMYAAFGLLWLALTVWGVRAAVRTLEPGYFAVVMATGIVSTAACLLKLHTVSAVLLWIAGIGRAARRFHRRRTG